MKNFAIAGGFLVLFSQGAQRFQLMQHLLHVNKGFNDETVKRITYQCQ